MGFSFYYFLVSYKIPMRNIFQTFSRALDGTTMYRVVLYALGGLAVYAILVSFFKILPYNGFLLLLSLTVSLSASFIANQLGSFFTKIPAHAESSLITGFILFFLFPPISSISDAYILVLASVGAVASKYILAYKGRQIFNPAAFSAVMLGIFGSGAMWWIGSRAMLPAVIVASFLIVKKMRRFELFFVTVTASFIPVILLSAQPSSNIADILIQHFVSWPILFFASVMVTEPLTVPPTRRLQTVYGAGVGLLSSISFHIGPLYSSPELALVIGNIFSYVVSMKQRLTLKLIEKKYIAKDTCEFVFQPNCRVKFSPGQYIEWTLPHDKPDTRGIRRYFTLASSPTEDTVRIGIKFYTPSSTFKKRLRLLESGDVLHAVQLCGDFTLPKDPKKKIGCVAGGIGITPFRSMVQYCIDAKDTRDIVLFYQNKTPEDVAYKTFFDQAAASVGIRIIYGVDSVGSDGDWDGEVGFLTPQIIQKYAEDVCERMWYISGPNTMVGAYKKILVDIGVARKNIKTDYFPGFA